MKRIAKESDILYVFDDLKTQMKRAETNLSILPALISRFVHLVLQDVRTLSQAKIYLNHVHTDMNYKFENFDMPITIILYLHFDYVSTSKRIEVEKKIKEHMATFKFKGQEMKFIKEEGIYIKFTKTI